VRGSRSYLADRSALGLPGLSSSFAWYLAGTGPDVGKSGSYAAPAIFTGQLPGSGAALSAYAPLPPAKHSGAHLFRSPGDVRSCRRTRTTQLSRRAGLPTRPADGLAQGLVRLVGPGDVGGREYRQGRRSRRRGGQHEYTRELDEYASKLKKSGGKGLRSLTKREHKLRMQSWKPPGRNWGIKAHRYEDVRETTSRIQKNLSGVKYRPTAND